MANVGIDPVIDVDRRFSIWKMSDIYSDAANNTGRYVPNVDDIIVDYSNGWWRCTHVDFETGYSTLIPWAFNNITDNTDETDIIVGGNSTTNDSYRIYVNTKKVPYEFSFDTRLKIYGSAGSYVKIFKDGNVEGPPISAVFNSAGAVVSENIQLENVVIPNTTVTAIKVPTQGNLVEMVETGEVLNAVVYSNSGAVLAIFKVIVVITNFVRTIDAGKKIITNISLVSPYISAGDDRLLEYPSNMTVDSSSLIGKVTYNDGTTQRYPVDGPKFKMLGLENYVTSQLGQTVPLVLTYTLATSEYSNNVKEVNGVRFINKSYSLTTVESDNLYSVKLYVVPYWNGANNKWYLDYYLYNLERENVYKVTNFIEYGVNSNAFDGGAAKWGVAQEITVSINLDKLGSSFSYSRHVQTFNITLHQAGSNLTSSGYYTLEYDNNSIFGRISYANVATNESGEIIIDFSNGYSVVTQWLEQVYRSTEPLYFPFGEAAAPTPTHVKIIIGSAWSREVPINTILSLIQNVSTRVEQGDLIRLEFIANYNTKRLQLATVGLVAKRI